jgi:hypothetical protein
MSVGKSSFVARAAMSKESVIDVLTRTRVRQICARQNVMPAICDVYTEI